MDIIIVPFFTLLIYIVNLYKMIIFFYVILSLLEHFQIINSYNKFVYTVQKILFQLTDPVLSRVRRLLPSISGIDLSPLIVILAIQFIEGMLFQLIQKF